MIGQFICDVVGGQVCWLSYLISQLFSRSDVATAWHLLVNGASLAENSKLFYISSGRYNCPVHLSNFNWF